MNNELQRMQKKVQWTNLN